MGNIVLLDDLTINKIAAGEVIERPASVVKEMVENSIDAGATNIVVEIKNGGISYIRVSDNGKGIAQDDLEIAFERHATSKIRSADDLDTVTSMGFRGEALASIAAVANVELISKTKQEAIGYRVVVEAGDVLEKEEMGCRTGTSITVRNLFFNTPVRYKFLKKDYTESGYIEDVITRIALVNPHVAIKLINTGKTVIQTNGSGELKNVVYSIYGKDVANGIMDVNYTYDEIRISGVIGKPEIARSNRSNQLFFVNKRYIKDKTLTAATEQAYKGLIPIGKFGFVILNLEINPSKVDVNVHPAKLEVRFQEENKVFQAIYHAIKDVLLKAELVTDTSKKVEENEIKIDRTATSFEERLRNLRESKKENNTNGLFGFRKQHEKQIEEYTEQESKIKTNNILEDVYKNKSNNDNSTLSGLTVGEISGKKNIGDPIDTTDVLAQLKAMKQKIENELVENNTSKIGKLNEETAEYNLEKNILTQENQGIKETENAGKIEEIKQNVEKENEVTIIVAQDEEEQNENEKQETQEKKEEQAQDFKNEEREVNDVKENEILENKIQDNKIEEINEAIDNLDDPEIKQEFSEIKEKMEQLDNNTQVVSEDFDEMYKKLFGRVPISENEEEKKTDNAIDIVKDNVSIFEDEEEFQKPTYKFVGIVFKTYIILEMKDEMYILDQHAAHERIMYEKIKKNYYSNEEKDSQLLLLPDVITLTHKEMDIAKENMYIFEKAGFSLEEFGENTIKLTGVPNVCIDLDTKDLFLETLDEINTVARTAKQEKEEKFIATVACKSAVKANMALTHQEVDKLMEQLLSLPNPFTCPHGRPTVIKMSKYDIERKFARK